jgi:hypothetical protein
VGDNETAESNSLRVGDRCESSARLRRRFASLSRESMGGRDIVVGGFLDSNDSMENDDLWPFWLGG